MVSFADIQSIYRNEKNIASLQFIPEDFYQQSLSILESLEEEHRAHLTKILEDIIMRRRNKIVLHALRSPEDLTPPTNINPIEREFFNEVASLIRDHEKRILNLKPAEEKKEPDRLEHNMVLIRILKPIPEITGSDLKVYGPFKEDDVTRLPPENAEILIKNSIAEKIEEDKGF